MLTHDNIEHELAWLEHSLRADTSVSSRTESFHAVSRRLAGSALAVELPFLDARLALLRTRYAIPDAEQEKPRTHGRTVTRLFPVG